jgi:DNA mismatch endonuclease (patch repair protein)
MGGGNRCDGPPVAPAIAAGYRGLCRNGAVASTTETRDADIAGRSQSRQGTMCTVVATNRPESTGHVTDHLTPQQRSANMRRIRARHTVPEVAVRSLLHRAGFRFRVAPRELPGRPDIVLPRHRLAVFVHGCYWHRHPECPRATTPTTNTQYWQAKFARNVVRDWEVQQTLVSAGWRVATIWECEVRRDPQGVVERLIAEIGDPCTVENELDRWSILRLAERRSRYLV